MLQLTYISTAAATVEAGAVAGILRASRRNNAAAGITGLLLYDGCRFLQALEGPEAAVARLFDRVKADPRHRAVVRLSTAEVAVPSFGGWAMAAQQVAAGEGASLPDLVDRLTAPVADRTVQALFRSFARVRHAA